MKRPIDVCIPRYNHVDFYIFKRHSNPILEITVDLLNSYINLMVITNLEEKENRKIWVPIRGGNRGGWSLFDWEKVREMPYRDREMYLGNSAKIGVLDKGGKWRKKDWYLKRNELTAD